MADPRKEDERRRQRAQFRLAALAAGHDELTANMLTLAELGNKREKSAAAWWLTLTGAEKEKAAAISGQALSQGLVSA